MLTCSTFVSNGPLAQLVERGANNGKVLCSRLIWTRFHFLFANWITFSFYHRFQFYATIGGFSSGENCVSAAVNHTIYGTSTKLANLQRSLCYRTVIDHNT